MDAALDTLDFDPDALREKYRQERDKRLRADGNDQYVEVARDFRHYVDDPYVEPGFTRAPLTDEVEVAIIGGGFGGLLAGARLREAGVERHPHHRERRRLRRHLVLEPLPRRPVRHRELHATCRCSRSSATCPKEKYSLRAGDPRARRSASAEHYGLYDNALLPDRGHASCAGTRTTQRWLDHHQPRRRHEGPLRGHGATGPLNRPKLPGIPGIDDFKGHTFHTSRWDYDYTGGDTTGGLTGLADKRVAIIGTGATAIQCVPHLGAPRQAALRLPAHALVGGRARQQADRSGVGRRRCSPAGSARGGRTSTTWSSGGRSDEDLVDDGWTDIFRNLAARRRPRAGRAGLTPRGARPADGAGRLPQDEPDPRPRGRDRQGPGHRRGAEALVPAVLQAADASTTSTCRPSTGRTSPWWTPATARASSG